MQFQNTFTVPLPPDEAWRVLMDVERITPCMPGAELTKMVDKTNFKGFSQQTMVFAGRFRFGLAGKWK